jgi:hypothetical protein
MIGKAIMNYGWYIQKGKYYKLVPFNELDEHRVSLCNRRGLGFPKEWFNFDSIKLNKKINIL